MKLIEDHSRGSHQTIECARRVSQSTIALLLVDDHAVVRLGLAALFATVPHFTVVGQASTAAEAMIEARRRRPNVVVMDVRLPDGSGLDACRSIRAEHPDTQVLILSSYAEGEAVVAAVLAGAAGYVLKSTRPELLIEAIERVAHGESFLDPGVTTAVLDRLRRGPDAESGPLAVLSPQERKIAPLIAAGRTNPQIAVDLSLSRHTVKTYVSGILRKLKLRRRTEMAAVLAGASRRSDTSPNRG